jgi:hypothetical protein
LSEQLEVLARREGLLLASDLDIQSFTIKVTLENFTSAEIVHEGRSFNGNIHTLA